MERQPGVESDEDDSGTSLDIEHLYKLVSHLAKFGYHERVVRLLEKTQGTWWASSRCAMTLAESYRRLGYYTQARHLLGRVLNDHPSNATAHLQLADIYSDDLTDHRRALDHYLQAVKIEPSNRPAWIGLSMCILRDRPIGTAIHALGRIAPSFVEPLKSDTMSIALMRMGRYSEAERISHEALKQDRASAIHTTRLGDIYLIQYKDPVKALGLHELAIRLDEQLPEAILGLINDFRMIGDYERARQYYRRFEYLFPTPEYSNRAWKGESLQGKDIVIRCEAGFGDTIQLIRFVRCLGARRTIVKSPPTLLELLSTIDSIDEVLSWEEDSPKADYEFHLEEIGRRLNIELANVGDRVPYFCGVRLAKSPESECSHRSPTSAKVGIVWRGARAWLADCYRCRSIAQSELSPLFTVDGVQLFSLQCQPTGGQADAVPSDGSERFAVGSRMIDLGLSLTSFVETAAAMLKLDLIISVDTATAHLAGALGRPVWVLLPFAPAWRWMLDRSDSPYYPSARIFRQPMPGDWRSVVASVCHDLRIEAMARCYK